MSEREFIWGIVRLPVLSIRTWRKWRGCRMLRVEVPSSFRRDSEQLDWLSTHEAFDATIGGKPWRLRGRGFGCLPGIAKRNGAGEYLYFEVLSG